jgi:hypothetical protein
LPVPRKPRLARIQEWPSRDRVLGSRFEVLSSRF